MSTKFRKIPVVIDADGPVGQDPEYDRSLAAWCGGSYHEHLMDGDIIAHPDPYIRIVTLEGTMVASKGDYIIRGVQGEFYPCKPDIFKATYEPVEF